MKNLTSIKTGESVYVESLRGSETYKARMEEMGFVVGQRITRVGASPLGTPIVYALLGTKVSLRRSEADGVRVSEIPLMPECYARTSLANPVVESDNPEMHACSASGACPGCCSKCQAKQQRPLKPHTLTLALIGNPNCGKTAFFNAASGGHERTGNYAGVTVTSVEGYVDFEDHRIRIIDLPGAYSLRAFSPDEAFVVKELDKGEVDAVINVVDSTNLERNLSLTLQLRERNLPMVVALNMYDEFEKSGSALDIPALEEKMGIPFIPTTAKSKKGVADVLRKAISLAEERIAELSKTDGGKDVEACRCAGASAVDACRYAEIRTLLSDVYKPQEGRLGRLTARLDALLAYRPVAYLSFLLMMWLVFEATFTLGAYPMEWMDAGVAWLSEVLASALPAGAFSDLLTQGIVGGVGSVIVFLPNILILYFLISLLEDSGYLARAAILADPFLSRVGLHGKSFIPMLMGFGCNVPAIMATRTIESYKSRLLTMLVLPFVTCSARMPVLVIFTGVFFAPKYAGTVLFSLYILGVLVTFASAWLLNRFIQRDRENHFVMEVPPYRAPVASSVLRHTWEKGHQYLRKMGGVILIASVVIWALGYFPKSEVSLSEAQQQEQSYLGMLGRAVQPALAPLGFDWKMSVGVLAGVGAKELMISTLGVLYDSPEDAEINTTEGASHSRLAVALRGSITQDVALAYLVFALLYFPCIATIATIAGESGKWKYAIFTVFYTTAVAYIAALCARWLLLI